MTVRITVEIPAGEISVERPSWGYNLSASGKEDLADVLVSAANAILRAYDLPPSITSRSMSSLAGGRLANIRPNLVEGDR